MLRQLWKRRTNLGVAGVTYPIRHRDIFKAILIKTVLKGQ